MTREELKAHCEKQIAKCEAFYAEDDEKLNSNKLYQEHKLILELLEKESVLDKIRAEIDQAADKQFQIAMSVADLNERYTHIQMENAYRHSLNIFDKCKAERGI